MLDLQGRHTRDIQHTPQLLGLRNVSVPQGSQRKWGRQDRLVNNHVGCCHRRWRTLREKRNIIANYGALTSKQATTNKLQNMEDEGRVLQVSYGIPYEWLKQTRNYLSRRDSSGLMTIDSLCCGWLFSRRSFSERKSHLGRTNATTTRIRTELSSLDHYVTTLG